MIKINILQWHSICLVIKKNLKNLIIIGHPDKDSFCYNGIFNTILNQIKLSKQECEVIDLYRDSFTRPRTKVIDKYKKLISWCEKIYIISPVWWFRLTPRMEIFFDEVLTPRVWRFSASLCVLRWMQVQMFMYYFQAEEFGIFS